jgi:Mrp family chromosome partitioning ATPase
MSAEVERIISQAKAAYDYVVLDSPPVLAVTDARILAGHAEATVLVVEPGRTRADAFVRAREALAQTNARLIGVILNKVRRGGRGYGYGYGYGYGHAAGSDRAAQPAPRPARGEGGRRRAA